MDCDTPNPPSPGSTSHPDDYEDAAPVYLDPPVRIGRGHFKTLAEEESRLLMKYSSGTRSSEVAAMIHVRRHAATTVPVPRVVDFDSIPMGAGPTARVQGQIVMEHIPGDTLANTWARLSTEQRKRSCLDIWDIVKAIRQIPRPPDLPNLYATVDGSPLHPQFVLGRRVDPIEEHILKTDDAFRDHLLQVYRNEAPPPGPDPDILEYWPRSRGAVFTHGDLKPHNIMVSEDGRVTSVLDWECAGFWPDYWENACMFSYVWEDELEWEDIMKQTKPDGWDYDEKHIKKAWRTTFFYSVS